MRVRATFQSARGLALHDASRIRESLHSRQRLGLRRPSAAFPIRVHPWLNPFENLVGRKLRQQLHNCFTLPRQNQIRRDFAQRLKHKPPQMRARMRQNQFRRVANFCRRRQSNPNPAAAARSELFWAGGQILFRATAICPAAIPAVSSFRGTRPTTAFTNIGEPGGQSTGDVCQSEDLRIGRSEKFCSRAIASKMIRRESPRLEPNATMTNLSRSRVRRLIISPFFSQQTPYVVSYKFTSTPARPACRKGRAFV